MTVGIYRITNLVNGKLYFGQSVDVEYRLKQHKRNEKHNDHLTNSINKYGVENFTFELEIATSIPYLNRLEKLFIRKYDTTNREKGYNKESGGGSNYVVSDETKQKISESLTGRTLTDEHKQNISEGNKCRIGYWKDKTLSEETKLKMSESHKGKTFSEEHKQNLSKSLSGENNPMYGKESPVLKKYARIIKAGYNKRKQQYSIKYNSKVIKRSVDIHKLIKWWNETHPTEPLHVEVNK